MGKNTRLKVLKVLLDHHGDANDGWMFGTEIMDEAKVSTGGDLYTALAGLVGEGLVERQKEPESRAQYRVSPHRIFEIERLLEKSTDPPAKVRLKPGRATT